MTARALKVGDVVYEDPSPVFRSRPHERRWFALYVGLQREFIVQRILKDEGLITFLPVEYRLRRNIRSKRKEIVQHPLLTRYIFVAFDEHPIPWFRVMKFQVVKFVVSVKDEAGELQPYVIAPSIIDRLAKHSARDLEQKQRREEPFKEGDLVRVVEGPFAGFNMRVAECIGQRAKGILGLLGSSVTVIINSDNLEGLTE